MHALVNLEEFRTFSSGFLPEVVFFVIFPRDFYVILFCEVHSYFLMVVDSVNHETLIPHWHWDSDIRNIDSEILFVWFSAIWYRATRSKRGAHSLQHGFNLGYFGFQWPKERNENGEQNRLISVWSDYDEISRKINMSLTICIGPVHFLLNSNFPIAVDVLYNGDSANQTPTKVWEMYKNGRRVKGEKLRKVEKIQLKSRNVSSNNPNKPYTL